MIPNIGLIIGVYVITRMVSFLTRREARSESIVVKVLAVFAILVTLVCVIDLLMQGQTT